MVTVCGDQQALSFTDAFVFVRLLIFLKRLQNQEQVTAAQNKEYDPMGPLPQGWGKIFISRLSYITHRSSSSGEKKHCA